jgi:hypothetical protein
LVEALHRREITDALILLMVGDADLVRPEHVVEMFRLFGGVSSVMSCPCPPRSSRFCPARPKRVAAYRVQVDAMAHRHERRFDLRPRTQHPPDNLRAVPQLRPRTAVAARRSYVPVSSVFATPIVGRSVTTPRGRPARTGGGERSPDHRRRGGPARHAAVPGRFTKDGSSRKANSPGTYANAAVPTTTEISTGSNVVASTTTTAAAKWSPFRSYATSSPAASRTCCGAVPVRSTRGRSRSWMASASATVCGHLCT